MRVCSTGTWFAAPVANDRTSPTNRSGRATRSEPRRVAGYLAGSLGLPAAQDAIDRLPSGDPSIASTDLLRVLHQGVVFHISDLDRDERSVVEEEFRRNDSGLRVIVATTTLAMGVNTPASAVVIAGLQHPGQPPSPYSVGEYKNMVGRAGRLGLAEKGQSFLIAVSGMEEHTVGLRIVFHAAGGYQLGPGRPRPPSDVTPAPQGLRAAQDSSRASRPNNQAHESSLQPDEETSR